MNAKWFSSRAGSFAVGAAVVVGLLFGGALAASVQTGVTGPGASAVQASTGAAEQAPVQTVAQAGKGVQPSPSSGPREGIKVHGHWIIEIRKPDGSLVTRREFDNELASSSRAFLARLFTREVTPGLWSVFIASTSEPGPCGTPPIPCEVVENRSSDPPTDSRFKTLSVASDFTVRLSGTATASHRTNLNQVTAVLGSCSGDTAPASCVAGGILLNPLTQRVFSALEVDAGQIIQITVVISFS